MALVTGGAGFLGSNLATRLWESEGCDAAARAAQPGHG